MFKIGDKVVYPMHGAGTIESIEEKEMLGNKENYYIIKMPLNGVKLMIPTSKIQDIGVREIETLENAEKAFDVFSMPRVPYVSENNWSKRYKTNVEKIKNGKVEEVAEVIHSLSHKHMEKGLAPAEKKMLITAKQILLSELSLTHSEQIDTIEERMHTCLEQSYNIVTQVHENEEL